jgi:hypothetical protein
MEGSSKRAHDSEGDAPEARRPPTAPEARRPLTGKARICKALWLQGLLEISGNMGKVDYLTFFWKKLEAFR